MTTKRSLQRSIENLESTLSYRDERFWKLHREFYALLKALGMEVKQTPARVEVVGRLEKR